MSISIANVRGECPYCKQICKEDEMTLDKDGRVHLSFNCTCSAEWDEVYALDYHHTDIIVEPEDEDKELDFDEEDEDEDFDDEDDADCL